MRLRTLVCASALALACHESSGDNADARSFGADAVGVAECDEYLATYERCIDKAPSEHRKTMRDNIKRDRAAWRTLAADQATRAGLAQTCTLARETARTVTQTYGCEW